MAETNSFGDGACCESHAPLKPLLKVEASVARYRISPGRPAPRARACPPVRGRPPSAPPGRLSARAGRSDRTAGARSR
eukprot:746960-Hanusia_phi.AAC.1